MQAIELAFIQLFAEMYQVLGDLGLVLIVFTLVVRLLLVPLTLNSLKLQKEMRKVQPELKKLKTKHGKDKQALQKAQMELYQKYNINPLAGCLPQLVQIGLFILLYRVLITFLSHPELSGIEIDPHFLWLNLTQADSTFILPFLAGFSQLILALMIAPGGEVADEVPNTSKSKKVQKQNEKEEDMADMAATMQKQMIFIMPVMTGFIAINFPSGLVVYWITTTLFSIVQQWYSTGPGGLVTYTRRAWNTVANLSPKK